MRTRPPSRKRLGIAVLAVMGVIGAIAFVISGHAAAPGWLVTGRAGQTATRLLDGRVLLTGGFDPADKALSSAELYDPRTGVFSSTGSMSAPRTQQTATLLPDGRVLITGGQRQDPATGSYLQMATAELYDPSTGSFSATGSMSIGRAEHTATLLKDGRVLIAGAGEEAGSSSAELYDPATGRFTVTGPMITPRTGHTATLLNDGTVLVVGGEDAGVSPLASAETYDPTTGVFSQTGSMSAPRQFHTATLLSNQCGCVLVVGGDGQRGDYLPSASAELYDPRTRSFSQTGSMETARSLHTATLLEDGLVLVAGGETVPPTGGADLSTAELYDPTTGAFRSTGSMLSPEVSNSATLLGDGRVLLAGGSPYDNPAQIYDPKAGTFRAAG